MAMNGAIPRPTKATGQEKMAPRTIPQVKAAKASIIADMPSELAPLSSWTSLARVAVITPDELDFWSCHPISFLRIDSYSSYLTPYTMFYPTLLKRLTLNPLPKNKATEAATM